MLEKSEMAMNMAKCYEGQNNKPGYKAWIINAKQWAPKGSEVDLELQSM